jgi:hypothetical protein
MLSCATRTRRTMYWPKKNKVFQELGRFDRIS